MNAVPRRPDPECARVAAGLISLFFLPETAMSEAPLDSGARIDRLERDFRRMRIGIVAGLGLVMAFALSAFGAPSDPVVRAEAVELLDAGAVRRATMSADSAGFVLTLLDGRGRPSGSLRLTAEPRLTVETGRGREVAGLGYPKVHQLTE